MRLIIRKGMQGVPQFGSRVHSILSQKMPRVASGQQVSNILSEAPKTEREFLGLTHEELNGKDRLSKDELLSHVGQKHGELHPVEKVYDHDEHERYTLSGPRKNGHAILVRQPGPSAIPAQNGHYNDDNVLCHIRANERTCDDGVPAYHVEEIQSDSNQPAQKQLTKNGAKVFGPNGEKVRVGYRSPDDEKKLSDLKARESQLREEWSGHMDSAPLDDAEFLKWLDKEGGAKNLEGEIARVSDERREHESRVKSAVPRNVLMNDGWKKHAMRRSLIEAARRGINRVTWTTGAQQVARYEDQLRANLKSLSWKHNAKETGTPDSVRLTGVDSRGNSREWNIAHDDLDDYVGSDMAEKIRDKKSGSLNGDEITVGGEGMKAHYDRALVGEANAIGKKYGVRVGRAKLDNGAVPGRRPGLGVISPAGTPDAYHHVHSIDLTPEMRADLLKDNNFSLFKALMRRASMTPEQVKLHEKSRSRYAIDRIHVAGDAGAHPDTLSLLKEDPSDVVAARVAQNPSSNGETTEFLSRHQNRDVRHGVARNPSASPLVLHNLGEREAEWTLLSSLASNPSTPLKTLGRIASRSSVDDEDEPYESRSAGENYRKRVSALQNKALMRG